MTVPGHTTVFSLESPISKLNIYNFFIMTFLFFLLFVFFVLL